MFSDRGIFWWSDTRIPDNQFAPDEAVAGLLTINDTGRISIELDGVLPSSEGRMAVFNQGPIPTGRSIAGLLKAENKRILAINLQRNGGAWRSAGLSSEKYTALYCLISHSMIPPKRLARAIVVDLGPVPIKLEG